MQKAKPEWEALKNLWLRKVNGHGVNFIEVDCETDSATADKYGVEGYPTIKATKGNLVVEYDAKPQINTLTKFVESVTFARGDLSLLK